MSTPRYRYYDLVMAAFVTVLISADIIGPGKVAAISLGKDHEFAFGAGVLFFPISYLFGDILTEVYGYARARKVVWTGFVALLFVSLMSYVVVALPPAQDWPNQAAYEATFGATPRIVAASLVAFWAGEFANSYVLAKMKVWSEGRFLFGRVLGSTVVGEAVDSLIFYPVAFYGRWPNSLILTVMVSNYLLKCGWELLAYPLTARIVAWLKRVENVDYYDRDTNFNPFHLDGA